MKSKPWKYSLSHTTSEKKTRIGFENYNLAQLLWDITDVV